MRDSASETWRAGAGVAALAAAPGIALEGYAGAERRATHVADTLVAAALALAAGEAAPVALVAVDVVAVDGDLCREIAAAVGLPPPRLVVCATHTHSAPAGVTAACAPSQAAVDADIRSAVAAACVRAVESALASLAPAELRLGRALSNGVVANRVSRSGPRDRRVSVLAARRLDRQPIGALTAVACHPTVLGAASTAISADLAGSLRASFAEAGQTVVVTGAAADASTRFTRRARDPVELQRLGGRLAGAARCALADNSSRPLPPVLEVADMALELPRKASGGETGLRALVRGQTGPTTLTAWRIGTSGWLFVPGEVSAVMGRRIETSSPFADTVVVGYAGGYFGYVVDRAHHARETYEARASPFGAEAADELVAGAGALLRRLK